MTKLLGKYARLYIDEEPIYLQAFEMDQAIEAQTAESSVYGDDFQIFEPLTAKGTMSLQARVLDTYRAPGDTSDQMSDKFFWNRMTNPDGTAKTTPAVVSTILRQAPVEGDDAFFTRGFGTLSFAVPRQGLTAIRFQLNDTGPLHFGKIIYINQVTLTDVAPTVTGPGVNLGDATSFVRAAFHMVGYTVNSGTVTDVTATLQSDDANTFTSPTDRLSAVFTSRGASWQEASVDYGLSTEDWHRVKLTGTGTAPWSVTVSLLCIAKTG